MGLDEDVKEAIVREVDVQVANRLATCRKECQGIQAELYHRIGVAERDSGERNAKVEAERELLRVQLQSLSEKLDQINKQLDGNGNPILIRVAMAEREVAELKLQLLELKKEDHQKEDRTDQWKRVFIQPLVPILFSWVGLGVVYLVYIAIHMGKTP